MKPQELIYLGCNREVVYPKGEQFIILDKQYIEYIDSETGAGFGRWEVHHAGSIILFFSRSNNFFLKFFKSTSVEVS